MGICLSVGPHRGCLCSQRRLGSHSYANPDRASIGYTYCYRFPVAYSQSGVLVGAFSPVNDDRVGMGMLVDAVYGRQRDGGMGSPIGYFV